MTDYTQAVNTLSTIALDTMTKNLADLVNDSGEKYLKHISDRGRIFVVNDAEKLSHPVLFGAGEATTYYDATTMAPAVSDTWNNLGSASGEIMKHALFTMHTATRNINYPQAMPAGNMIPFVSNFLKVNMRDILRREENLALFGDDSGATVVPTGAFTGDDDAEAYTPMSLRAILDPYLDGKADDDNNQADAVYRTLGGLGEADLSADAFAEWLPNRFATADATGGDLIEDLQHAVLMASYSGTEAPDLVMTTSQVYEKFLDLLRAKTQINDKVILNLGTESAIPFAGMMVDWSRMLTKSAGWDMDYMETDDEGSTWTGTAVAEHPVLGINTQSLRMNVVTGGGISDEKLGFIQKVGETQKHPLLPNIFDRIQYKRCWSFDNGRRSMFSIGGFTV